jgi:Zn-dependent peptidase ImmA (M78 family)
LAESSSELDVTLVSTWLRAGELSDAYERGRGWRYNAAALTAMLPELRERAARPDPELLGDLAEMVSRAGVVLTFVAPPNKLPLYGMTRWIDKRVPVIQQTGRRQKDGFLIWAFFHEIGHVLNDPRGDVHLDFTTEKKRTSAAETAANKFAFEVLFGADGLNPFKDLRWDSDIRRVAHQVGVSPGVAVHQLHRRRYLPYNVGNSLLVELGTD